MTTSTDLALDADPLTVDCDPEPYGCGQVAGDPCVTIAAGRFYGTPKRRPCQRRARKAGVVLAPTRPDEVAAGQLRRSGTAAGRRRAQGGRVDWAGHADR